MFQDPSCFSEVLIRNKVKTKKEREAQWILEFLITTFLFLQQYIILLFIFFVWTSRVPRNVENLKKQTALATKMEMNGRKKF